MTDPSATWERLCGGPCDGTPVWADPECWAVIVTRDSDRQPWCHHEITEDLAAFAANQADLYLRVGDAGRAFAHAPHGLERSFHGGQPVWQVRHDH